MESKKISQLATELTPSLSDLTIIGDPNTGISKKITLSQMASLFTGTVEEYANFAAFPLVGVADTIYVAKDTNVIYRWDSTAYVVLSPNIIASLVFNDANGFDGTIALVGSVATLTITTALTSGSVPFIGASGALTQDNAKLFWDNTNKWLGIGTNVPSSPLDVHSTYNVGIGINNTTTNNSLIMFANQGTSKWRLGNVYSSGSNYFGIYDITNSLYRFTILNSGEVGIGITNPTTKFHIDGGSSALIANLDADVSIAKSLSFRSDNSNRINLEVSGTESGSNAGADFFLRTYTDAGALLETPFQIKRSTGLATFKNIAITGLTSGYLPKANGLSALSNSLIWDNGTNVGIGNTNTTYNLDVTGTGRFTSTLLLGGALSGTSASFSLASTGSGAVVSVGNVGSGVFGGLAITDSGTYPMKIWGSELQFLTGSSSFGSATTKLTIASTGAATFSSSVTAGGEARIYYSKAVGGTYPLDDSGFSGVITVNSVNTTNSLSGIAMYVQSNYQAGAGIFAKRTGTDAADMVFYAGSNLATEKMRITSGGVVQIAGLTSNGTVSTQSSNGSLYVSSDANLKIEDGFVENGLGKVLALKPRYFYWKDKEAFSADRQLGFYAQEVNAVSEETANTPPEGCGWGIYDRGLVALLTAAIQEQQIQIQNLQEQINVLAK